MATLNDLANPHFSRMTHEERFELIRTLRTDRRMVKEKPATQAKKTKTALGSRGKRSRKTTLTGDLAGMSQEQLAQLMELLSNADTD